MTGARRSLQDLIRSRQQGGFVGRRGELSQYQENFRLPLDDERRRFLFNIHGNAGVGKTYLTKQLQKLAGESGALTAYTDESVDDVTSVMSAMAEQFGRSGAHLSDFEKRARVYRQRRHELESDPQAPEGVAAFLTRTAVTIGLHAARDVPFAGSLLAPVDDVAVGDQVNRAREYIMRRFKDHGDVSLLISPVDELTRVFVNELNGISQPIALFFDTYERTASVLDRWLQSLYDERYGELPNELITTISGQVPLNPNVWGDYLPVIGDIPLEPFSDAEARQFLASKNITDEPTIADILTLSGRLPMWLVTLAEARPDNAAGIGDPVGGAVERFLKWEDNPDRRSLAITAALPRALNQDVLGVIATSDQARELFGWLRGLPFVTRQADSWKYHEVVRTAMLRLQRAQSPHQWRAIHAGLAQAHGQWATEVGNTGESWSNHEWIDHIREETYHLLCASPSNNLPLALAQAVQAAKNSIVRARQWAELITDAGRDTDDPALRKWGQRLSDGIHDTELTEYLTCMIDDAPLTAAALSTALKERGNGHGIARRYVMALADFSRAVELDPGDARAIAGRGLSHRVMGHYEEALADFN